MGGQRVGVFVDRVDSMAALHAVAADLGAQRGRVLVVEADSGMGKSALLRAFTAQAGGGRGSGAGAPGPRSGDAAAHRTVLTECSRAWSGAPFQVATTALLSLSATERRGQGVLRAVGGGFVRSAPRALGALVPGLGAVAEVGQSVAEAALRSGVLPGDSFRPQQQAVARQFADTVVSVAAAPRSRPVMLLVDDVQYIDLSSLQVLHHLVERLPDAPVSLVLGHTTGSDGENATAVAALLEEWERREGGAVRRHRLPPLPIEAISDLLGHRVPGANAAERAAVARRLATATNGSPIFIEQCLQLLRPGRLNPDVLELPGDLPRAVRRRFQQLESPEREALVVGATHGLVFTSRTVADVLDEPHDRVMELLRRVSERHGLVHPVRDRPEWARSAGADLYRFEHQALWHPIYLREQTLAQREDRHSRIADALLALPAAQVPQPSRELLLSIAEHLRRSGTVRLADSAEAHHRLARETALTGIAFAEAEQQAIVAVQAARGLPPGAEGRDRLLAESVELLLSLTEVRWQGHRDLPGGLRADIDTLAAEAEEAAERCADPRLIARATLMRGKTLLVKHGLEPSLAKLREAVARAAETGDPVVLFVAKVEYGRQLPKQNLAAGLEVLRQAEELYASEPQLGDIDNPVLQHARNLNEMQLGVNLFDAGSIGEALTRLERCVGRLRTEPLNTELPIALNYLAQVHNAMGAYQEAAQVLREAREIEEKRGAESGWHAYNTALLAQVLALAPENAAEARRLAEQAWMETQRTWLANLVPIVRNLYAEVLLTVAADDPEALEEADRLADATCVETELSGMVRSRIAALALRARIRLAQGAPDSASQLARAAVDLLDEYGDMPALRTEEVLYEAATALRAGGMPDEARELVERARSVVEAKSATIDVPEQRRRFRTEVPLNRRILRQEPS